MKAKKNAPGIRKKTRLKRGRTQYRILVTFSGHFGSLFVKFWGPKSDAKIIGEQRLKLESPPRNPKGPSRAENLVR